MAKTKPPQEPRGRGRPKTAFNPAVDARVRAMSGMGANITAIAALEGMDRSVLLRLHGESLEVGRHQANLNVARAFYKAASSGSDWRASLSWLRHQAGWLEASQPQVVRYDGSKQAANEASRAAGSADWGNLLDGGDNVDSPGEPTRRRPLQRATSCASCSRKIVALQGQRDLGVRDHADAADEGLENEHSVDPQWAFTEALARRPAPPVITKAVDSDPDALDDGRYAAPV